jgi:hypothetical protein
MLSNGPTSILGSFLPARESLTTAVAGSEGRERGSPRDQLRRFLPGVDGRVYSSVYYRSDKQGELTMAEPSSSRDQLAAKISSLSDLEVTELLDYIKIMETMRAQLSSPGLFEDEVASLLVSAAGFRSVEIAAAQRARRRASSESSASTLSTTYLA